MAAITVTDITTALRDAGIDYTVEHPGTSNAEVIVGDLRMAPALDEDGHAWDGINSVDGNGRHDWHATVADAVERAAAHTGVDTYTVRVHVAEPIIEPGAGPSHWLLIGGIPASDAPGAPKQVMARLGAEARAAHPDSAEIIVEAWGERDLDSPAWEDTPLMVATA